MIDSDDSESISAVREEYENLLLRVERTRDGRMRASIRLAERSRKALFAQALLAMVVILISMLSNYFDLNNVQKNWFNFLSIAGSILIIILAFQEASGEFSVNSYILRKSAIKLVKLHVEMKARDPKQRGNPSIVGDYSRRLVGALNTGTVVPEYIDYSVVDNNKPYLKNNSTGPYEKVSRAFWVAVFWVRTHLWALPHLIYSTVSLASAIELATQT